MNFGEAVVDLSESSYVILGFGGGVYTNECPSSLSFVLLTYLPVLFCIFLQSSGFAATTFDIMDICH